MTILEKIRGTDLLVVGSGFFGLTVAYRAACDGYKVLVIDRRDHPGGNAWSYVEPQTGIEVHQYGSHLFHTSNHKVWDFVNQFSKFNEYRHTVMTRFKNKTLTMPINLSTIQGFYELSLSPEEARDLINQEIRDSGVDQFENLEEKAISLVGKGLYEALIKGYTSKQWETDPKKLPAEIITRLPVRFDYNPYYFSDKWEGLPVEGYHSLISNMVTHERIDLELSLDFSAIKQFIPSGKRVVYTGPIDEYFDFCQGALSWRTLDFQVEVHDVLDYQGTSVMNFADIEIPWTRIHEFKHLHPERTPTRTGTVISREYSRFASKSDEPYYPVNTSEDRRKLDAYRGLSKTLPNVFFGGRLGTYQYLDMHMAIASALTKYENEILPSLRSCE